MNEENDALIILAQVEFLDTYFREKFGDEYLEGYSDLTDVESKRTFHFIGDKIVAHTWYRFDENDNIEAIFFEHGS